MKNDNRYVGLDVHAETIAVAVVETDGEVRFLGTIPNRAETVRRLVKRVGPANRLRFCYEAGPTGYVLYWQLTGLGAHCDVVARTLVPVKPGDRVKTDRRDAEKLAVLQRGGHRTPVWVPDQAHEALRDVVRAREAAKSDQLRARHRLQKFLLRHGRRPPQGIKAWTQKHLDWVRREVHFEALAQEAVLVDHLAEVEHARERIRRLEGAIDTAVEAAPACLRAVIEALQGLRGIAKASRATMASMLGSSTGARRGARRKSPKSEPHIMKTEPIRGRSRGPRKGGSSTLLCDRPLAGLAMLVRGSARRITTMTAGLAARSANIRVINRRYSRFDRRLVCSGNRDAPTQSDGGTLVVDRSFHIRSLSLPAWERLPDRRRRARSQS